MESKPHKVLLEKAKKYNNERRYADVEALLAGVPRSQLITELELYFLLCLAQSNRLHHDEAKSLLESAEEEFARSGQTKLICRWQNLYAIQLTIEGNLVLAEDLLNACIGTSELEGFKRLVASAYNGLGVIASVRGEPDQAVAQFSRAITGWSILGDRAGVGKAHHNLGVVHREWEQYTEATTHFLLATDYFSVSGTEEEKIFTSAERAMLLQNLGDNAMAESMARGAVERASRLSNKILNASTNKSLGAILSAKGKYGEATQWLHSAVMALGTMKHHLLRAEIYEENALLAIRTQDLEAAETNRLLAIKHYSKLGAKNHCRRLMRRLRRQSADRRAISQVYRDQPTC